MTRNIIEEFKLKKNNQDHFIYLIKKPQNLENILSLLFIPDKNFSSSYYSTHVNLNNIRNINDEPLNLMDFFFNNKVIIEKMEDFEIVIAFYTNEKYDVNIVDKNVYLMKIEAKYYKYGIIIKKNDYYVLWRDPNFLSEDYYAKHLNERILFCKEEALMNLQVKTSNEEALQFILDHFNDKIILITSIEKNKSGKRFVELVRKILGFDIIVLFYSNNTEHFKWIQDFDNCLYTDKRDIYEEYITHFNEQGLKNLKKKVENKYKKDGLILKEFSDNFISYVNNNIIFPVNRSPYFRKVKIYCKNQDKYLCMTTDGQVIVKSEESEDCWWTVTLLNKKITLFSNGYYLKEGKKGNVIGYKYMTEWSYRLFKYTKENNDDKYYCFINSEKEDKNILSIEGDKIKVNKDHIGKNEIFLFKFPVQDDSFLTDKIYDISSSVSSLDFE